MFLHLGGDVLIKQDKIIAILDLEMAMKNSSFENFLKNTKEKHSVRFISEPGKEKSIIITTEENYLSPISSTTLLKRSNSIEQLED
jgi:hypothetical protein